MKTKPEAHLLLRGTLCLMFSQFIFISCGYGIHIYLARVFGPENYGIFGVVISILIWFELSIIRGLPTTVQNFVSKDRLNAYTIKKLSLKIQLYFAALVTVVLFLTAPGIATILKDNRLVFYLRLSSIDVLIYGAYAIYLGVQNGLKEFGKQSIMIITYSLGKLFSIVILVALGLSVSGALVGNIIGSICGLLLGIGFTRLERKPNNINQKELIKFTIPIIFLFLGNNLLYNLDLWCVKFFLADEVAGYYVAAQNVARIPLFLFFALSFTLLPSLSKSISDGDKSLTKAYILQAMRIIFLIITPITLLVLSTSKSLVSLLYSDSYESSAELLNILIIGFAFLTFFITMSSVVIAANKPHLLFMISSILVLIDLLLNTQLVPLLDAKGAAFSTVVTAILGVIIIVCMLVKKFKAFINLKSLAKILFASFCVYGISKFYSTHGGMLILNYLFLGSLYVVILTIIGEISKYDLVNLKTMLKLT